MREHEPQEFCHEWLYLHVEVPEHLVTAPGPISLMMFLSTPDQRRYMAPAARREHADTSLASNRRFGLQKPTSVLRVFKIMVGFMFYHLPVRVMTRASGVEGGALWDLR